MMRIGTKLALGTGTLLALGMVIGTVSYLQTSSLHRKLDELTSVREPVNTAANELKKRLSEAESVTLGYFLTGDTTLRATLRTSGVEFSESREMLLPLLSEVAGEPAASTLLRRVMDFYVLAEGQIGLRDEQSTLMRQLLENLDGLDALLTNSVAASVRAEDPIAFRRLQVALEMQIQMNATVKALGTYLATGEERFRARIAAARQSFSHFLQVYQVVTLSAEEKAWASELIRRSDRSLAMASSLADLQRRRRTQLAAFLLEYEELGSLIDDPLLRSTTTNLAAAKEQLIAAGERANSTIVAVLLLGMVLGVGAAVVTTRNITSPLRHLVAVMNAVDHEGVVQKVELRSSDEFRQVSDSFNTMMRRLAAANERLRDAERERLEGLRLFAHSVQRAQEEERSRIARELHDDICQRLAGMKYHVEVLEEGVRPTTRRVAKQLRGIREELDKSVAEVRRISSNLRPSVLDDFGLVTALGILCKDFQAAHAIDTTFRVDPAISGRIDPESETALYRIAQQALSNAARHAHATTIALTLASGEGNLILRVADNGRGLASTAPESGRAQKGFGLVSMRERAELLGGRLLLESNPGRGTTVSVTIPRKEV